MKKYPNQVFKMAGKVTYQATGQPAIKITFPFSYENLAEVKSLPGRKYHSEGSKKYWTCPLSLETINKLQEWEYKLDEELLAMVGTEVKRIESAETLRHIDIPGLRGSLFPFQKEGVSFLEKRNGRALIADEMGLGKTVQALAWLQLRTSIRPAIIVVPASLKLNWAKESSLWMESPKVQILSGTKCDIPIIGEIIIINYDILEYWVDNLRKISPKALILDECHYFKNKQAKRTKAVLKLSKGIDHIIALSGTPIVNRPIEFYNALSLIDSNIVPNFWRYTQRYCGAKHNGYGWDFSGATNTQELNQIASTIMIRRLKKNVLTELPDKIKSFVPVELSNRKDYQRAEEGFISFVKEQKGVKAALRASNAQALAEIEGLKQLAVTGKLKQSIGWIKDFLETDEKLVVFAVHKFVIDALMQAFPEIAVKIDGSVSQKDRDVAVTEFQHNSNIKLFIGNIKAAGVGLTLTAASNVAILELPWTPGDLAQAEDRCHRIGQKNSVTIHYLLAEQTIEQRIASLIDEKRKVLDSVIDGKQVEESSLFSELINSYCKAY